MLSADKKAMEANYARGGLEVQKKMVKFYSVGMIGITTSSLVALLFGTKSARDDMDERASEYKVYLFYSFAFSAMLSAILSIVVSTLCTSFGTVEFLCGHNALEVHDTVRLMRKRHIEVVRWFFVCRICFLLQSFTWCLDSENYPVIITESVIISVGIFIICYNHFSVVQTFTPDKDKDPLVFVTSLFAEYGGDVKTTNEEKTKAKLVKEHADGNDGDAQNIDIEEKLSIMRQECRRQLKEITYQNKIWYCREEDNTSTFSKAYGVLESGSLYLYRDLDEYECAEDIMTDADAKPLKLIKFTLETNKKALERLQIEYSSVRHSFRKFLFGTSALTLADVVGADFNVEHAANNFQFCLVQGNDSELNFNGSVFLMAEDSQSYREWTIALRRAIDCYNDLSNLFHVNKSLALTHDPKAAVAFMHDHSTKRLLKKREKERRDEERKMEDEIIESIKNRELSIGRVRPSAVAKASQSAETKYTVEEVRKVERKLELREKLSCIQYRGILWTKSLVFSEEPQSFFTRAYSVLENAQLSFYKSIDDYNELGNTYNGFLPLKLKHYKLTTNRTTINRVKSEKSAMTLRKRCRSVVVGSSELRIRDTIGRNFDYMNAVGNFQFCLVPKSSKSDLTGHEAVILMAEDRKTFDHWIMRLSEAIDVFCELEDIQVFEDRSNSVAQNKTRMKLTLDAESAVSRSNHQIKGNIM